MGEKKVHDGLEVIPRIQLPSFLYRVSIPYGPSGCWQSYKTLPMSLPNVRHEMIDGFRWGRKLEPLDQPASHSLLMLGSFTAAFQVWLSPCSQGLHRIAFSMMGARYEHAPNRRKRTNLGILYVNSCAAPTIAICDEWYRSDLPDLIILQSATFASLSEDVCRICAGLCRRLPII